MRIGILSRGLSIPVGGARRVLDHILRELPRLAPEHDIISFQPPGTPVAPGTVPVWVPSPHPLWWEWVSAGRVVAKAKPDVLLAPKTLLPFGIPASVKTVSLVHDLLYFPIQGHYLNEYRRRDIVYNRLFYKKSVRRADRLICISRQTQQDVVEVCGVPESKTRVVLHGVEVPQASAMDEAQQKRVREKYGLAAPYIFYSGSLSPRKNMLRGVRAWEKLAAAGLPHDLVVTAGKSWHDGDVAAAVAASPFSSRFHRLGAVPDEDLPALYAAADVYFFPSLYEGFGLPVLEAMACGCPVVASAGGAVGEAAGDAAWGVNPLSEDDMAAGLEKVLTDAVLADELRRKGHQRAAQFSWNSSMSAMLDVLLETAQS